MANFTCEQCGAAFVRDKSGTRPIRFCCGPCYQAFRAATGYNKTSIFKPGLEPWNKGVKGIHLSPSTEFKSGAPSVRLVPVGTVRVRNDKNGAPRNHIKVAEPNKWRLLVVVTYEKAYGPVPPGCVVHHRDHNSLNDNPINLLALTRAEHIAAHRSELNRDYEALQAERLQQPSLMLEVA